MSLPVDASVLEFEGFHLDPRQRLLFNGQGEVLPLPSRAFDTLLFLARNPHQLIDKQSLMKAVWPQAIVEENNLSQHISLLRKVLGELPNQHRFIVTVPGRGFRFVPQVQKLEVLPWLAPRLATATAEPLLVADPASPSALAPTPAPAPVSVPVPEVSPVSRAHRSGRLVAVLSLAVVAILAVAGYALYKARATVLPAPSIAVLAFADMSPAQDQGYFADGLSEELIDQLGQVPDLRVIGRTSSFAFKGRPDGASRIGELLGVNYILEGSVRKSGDRVRISALLLKASDGSQLWSQTYERKLDDVFAIQDEISHRVAEQLQLKLDARDLDVGGTKNVAAYDEFLAARTLLASNDDVSLGSAAPHLEQAVRLDPAFVTAKLWLIDAYVRTVLGTAPAEGEWRRQDQLIDEVVAQARGTPVASFALSYRTARGHDLVELARLLKDALRVQGSPGERARLRYGQFLMGVGDPTAALRELEVVKRDDPLNDFVRTPLMGALEISGQSDLAAREIQNLLSTPSGNTRPLHGYAVRMAQGQPDRERLRRAVKNAVESGDFSADEAHSLQRLLDDPDGALQELKKTASASHLQGNVYFASNIAQNAAFLGDHALALQALHAMLESHFTFETTAFVLWRPVMREVRQQPEFKDIVRERGLEQYWRTTGNWGDFCKPRGADDFECR